MASWRVGWRPRPGCGPMTSWARRPGTSSWPATRPMRPSTTLARPSTRARGWPTKRCWTMCSRRWHCWTGRPRPARGCCAGACSRCARPRWTSRATGSGSARTSRRMAELAEALDDDRRRAHAAWRRSALAQRIADYAAMEAAARQAVEWARRAGDDEIRLLAQRMLAMSLAFQGRPAEGRAHRRGGAGRGARAGAAPRRRLCA